MTHPYITAFAIVLFANVAYVAWGFWSHARRLRADVFSNLDAAKENGDFGFDGHCFNMTADDLAVDLSCFAADVDNEDPAILLPYVRQWMKQQ